MFFKINKKTFKKHFYIYDENEQLALGKRSSCVVGLGCFSADTTAVHFVWKWRLMHRFSLYMLLQLYDIKCKVLMHRHFSGSAFSSSWHQYVADNLRSCIFSVPTAINLAKAAVTFRQDHGYLPSCRSLQLDLLASTKLYCLATEAHLCEQHILYKITKFFVNLTASPLRSAKYKRAVLPNFA